MLLFVDVTAPLIVCPASIEAETSKDESVGHVEWQVPAAVDNSGFQPTVTVIPALVPPVMLPIGNNSITYTAEDNNKNKARCTFTITVRGRPLLSSVSIVIVRSVVLHLVVDFVTDLYCSIAILCCTPHMRFLF